MEMIVVTLQAAYPVDIWIIEENVFYSKDTIGVDDIHQLLSKDTRIGWLVAGRSSFFSVVAYRSDVYLNTKPMSLVWFHWTSTTLKANVSNPYAGTLQAVSLPGCTNSLKGTNSLR
jgi:hypothetical protein